jgi:hypothetical protein
VSEDTLQPKTGTTRHFGEALVKLIGPFWGKPRIAALLQSYINQVQRIEDVCWDILERYTVDGADSARLDVLGRVVGVPRLWSSDDIYRAVIRGKIRTNLSRGLTNDIIEVLQLVLGDTTFHITVSDMAPATALVWTAEAVDAETLTAIEYLLPHVRSAGVQLHFFWTEDGAGEHLWGEGFWGDDAGWNVEIL